MPKCLPKDSTLSTGPSYLDLRRLLTHHGKPHKPARSIVGPRAIGIHEKNDRKPGKTMENPRKIMKNKKIHKKEPDKHGKTPQIQTRILQLHSCEQKNSTSLRWSTPLRKQKPMSPKFTSALEVSSASSAQPKGDCAQVLSEKTMEVGRFACFEGPLGKGGTVVFWVKSSNNEWLKLRCPN